MSKTIRVDEWLAALEAESKRNADGFTVTELAESTGRTEKWCRDTIKRGIAAGKVAMNGRRTKTRMDGLPCHVPVYKVVKK